MTPKTNSNDHTVSDRHISSPNGQLELRVGINSDNHVWYSLHEGDQTYVNQSFIRLSSTEHDNLLTVEYPVEYSESEVDTTWEQVWGQDRYIRDNHHELALESQKFTVRFRLFNDGLGFRFELHGEGELSITNETTDFNVDKASSAWWIPALGGNHYEHLYAKNPIHELDTAHTPITLELPQHRYLAIHEAALYDYGSMNIVPTENGLASTITPISDDVAAVIRLPFQSPWRTLTLAEKAHDLGRSHIMLNLNEPSKIVDTSWIQPTKFMGIWWAMFIGTYTWASGDKHGATTANAFKYINAAKRLGISALLIEGWNQTWDDDWTKNGAVMNHMLPYPDFDIHAITSYAHSQGIDIVGHHETCGHITHYESELPEAYDYYRHFGVRYIKTGYVAHRLDTGEFHSSQRGVRHYQKTVELAAERQVMLDIHEPVKGTGIERTWPNLMTREGVMGQEYEGGAITPEHTTVLPFTRSLAGPMDYTPGIFNLSGTTRKVQSTLGKQLALYVTLFSPMQMVSDLPEHYEGQAAFEFLRHVPVTWEHTVPIDGVIGDYFITARKDWHSDDWYVGGVTDEGGRTVTVNLSFLKDHHSYTAHIYKDAPDAHWQRNPEAHTIEQQTVTNTDSLEIMMAPGGGFAIRLTPEGMPPPPYPMS